EHPRPRDTADAERLRAYLTETSDKQIAALRPKDAKSLAEYRRVVGTALRVMIHDELPKAEDVEAREVGDKTTHDGVLFRRYLLGRKGSGEQVPAVGLMGKEFDGPVVVWVCPEGKAGLLRDGKWSPEVLKALEHKV